METFKIEVKETISKIIEIEASSKEDAYSKVKEMYNTEKIILDSEDYIDTEFLELED